MRYKVKHIGVGLLTALAFVASSCSDRPDDILSEKELVSLMSDMRIAGAMFDTGQGRSTGYASKEDAQLAVMREHGVSPEQYRKTIRWYGENLDKFDDVNCDVVKNLEKRITKYDPSAKERVTDLNNVWPYQNHLIMTPGLLSDGVVFTIPDPAIEKGGYAELKMKTSDPNTSMTVMVGVDYTDGSSAYTARTASGFSDIKIRVQSDTTKNVKRLYGYFRPTNELIKTMTIDSIALIKMPLDTTEYYRIKAQTNLEK